MVLPTKLMIFQLCCPRVRLKNEVFLDLISYIGPCLATGERGRTSRAESFPTGFRVLDRWRSKSFDQHSWCCLLAPNFPSIFGLSRLAIVVCVVVFLAVAQQVLDIVTLALTLTLKSWRILPPYCQCSSARTHSPQFSILENSLQFS